MTPIEEIPYFSGLGGVVALGFDPFEAILAFNDPSEEDGACESEGEFDFWEEAQEAAREEARGIARKIAAGHARGLNHDRELVDAGIIDSTQEYEGLVVDVITNGLLGDEACEVYESSTERHKGKVGYFDEDQRTIVIYDPKHKDLGTAYGPFTRRQWETYKRNNP